MQRVKQEELLMFQESPEKRLSHLHIQIYSIVFIINKKNLGNFMAKLLPKLHTYQRNKVKAYRLLTIINFLRNHPVKFSQ